MSLNATLLQNSISSSNIIASSVNSTSLGDIQSSRYAANLLANSGNSGTRQSPSDIINMPGPSGIGPMQHAPLVSI